MPATLTSMYLVLIETSGNQSFIFSTNKLRENLGASELIYRIGTEWLLQVIHTVTNGKISLWHENPEQCRGNLLNQTEIIEQPNPDQAVEVIAAASGKALFLTQKWELAEKIITHLTAKALKEAPGVDVCGVYVEFDWNTENLGEINRKVHEKHAYIHATLPGVSARFPRLPVVAECATSGLPAAKLCKVPGGEERYVGRSQVSLTKERFRQPAFDRMNRLITHYLPGRELVPNLDNLEKQLENADWLAIAHIDGNGLGEIFLKFHDHVQALINQPCDLQTFNNHYVWHLRQFSIALDRCNEAAFVEALDSTFPETNSPFPPLQTIPLIPLILGGDDLTILCEGKSALTFTQKFLQLFEQKTFEDPVTANLAEKALGQRKLSACAGVAIVKPHFPFYAAYSLAEELIKSAKTVKQRVTWADETYKLYPCSAIDFHIVYDSSNLDLSKSATNCRSIAITLANRKHFFMLSRMW